VRIGKYAVPILLLATLAIGTVAAVAYVVLTWSISMTVAANPRVHFWDGTAANTMALSMNIFPDIRTIDEDNDVWDLRSVTAGAVYIRVESMNTTAINELRIRAFNGTGDLFDLTWNSADSAGVFQGPYVTSASNDYDLWIEVEATSVATKTPETITVQLKVEEP